MVPIATKTLPLDKRCEFCMAKFNCDIKYIVVRLCKSPNCDFEIFISMLNNILYELYSPDKYLIVGGDFNITFAAHNPLSVTLVSLMTSSGLASHGFEITREISTSSSQIDNIFSNIPTTKTLFVSCITDMSDHYGQIL